MRFGDFQLGFQSKPNPKYALDLASNLKYLPLVLWCTKNLALHSSHVDKLVVPDSDEEDGDADDSMCEEAFRAALGTNFKKQSWRSSSQ